jgi:hypothetical protein
MVQQRAQAGGGGGEPLCPTARSQASPRPTPTRSAPSHPTPRARARHRPTLKGRLRLARLPPWGPNQRSASPNPKGPDLAVPEDMAPPGPCGSKASRQRSSLKHDNRRGHGPTRPPEVTGHDGRETRLGLTPPIMSEHMSPAAAGTHATWRTGGPRYLTCWGARRLTCQGAAQGHPIVIYRASGARMKERRSSTASGILLYLLHLSPVYPAPSLRPIKGKGRPSWGREGSNSRTNTHSHALHQRLGSLFPLSPVCNLCCKPTARAQVARDVLPERV